MGGAVEHFSGNSLLRSISEKLLEPFRRELIAVDIPEGFALAKHGELFSHVYFLSSGIASVLAVAEDGRKAESGMIGREGLTSGASLVADRSGSFDVTMQIAGAGHRMSIDAFRAAVQSEPVFRDQVTRFAYAYTGQVEMTALINGAHNINQRLARWLLMCHDRLEGEKVHVTHEYMAMMLATRRPSVTVALHILEGERLIKSTRGVVHIRDRTGLEAFAGTSYGGAEREYERMFGLHNSRTDRFHGIDARQKR